MATWRCESDMWVPQPRGHADPQPHGHVGPTWRGPRALPTSTWVPPVPLEIPPCGPHHHHIDTHMASHAATQPHSHVANSVPPPSGIVGPTWRGPRSLPIATWVPPVPYAVPPCRLHYHHIRLPYGHVGPVATWVQRNVDSEVFFSVFVKI
jgi:hypothetical protein